MGDEAGRAVDAAFAPWTLPLLWTRPDPFGWTLDGTRVTLAETRLELTRMIIITADAAMRSRLQERYLAEFSTKVKRLLKR